LVPLLLAALVTAASPGWVPYRVRTGDNLESIAKRYHTTVSRLVQVNRLPGNGNLIYAGDTIKVPAPPAPKPVIRRHRVVSGDSLSELAVKYGVSTTTIKRANKIGPSNIIRLGETLVIPVTGRTSAGRSSTSGNTFAGRTYASSVVSAASRNRAALARRNVPNRMQMRSIIVRTARRHGVDPNLALAVSWQESGWNMRAVSVANAVGAMQVIPSTGQWISTVVGRRLNLLNPHDNATAGVVLLKVLTRSTSEEKAIAGYYQGLRSVRERGMYPDTKRYVANVLALKRHYARR
jgi:LysM repeat protein